MEKKIPAVFFEDRDSWRKWLSGFYDKEQEIWVIYFKKHTKKQTIIYREALEEALCFGWIDGIVKTIDEERYMQRFTPRRAKSNWSETNIRLAQKLEIAGKMHTSGLKFRKHWEEMSSPKKEEAQPVSLVLAEFEEALQSNQKAYDHYHELPASARRLYNLWIGSAKKEETRLKRIAESLSLLEKGEKLGLK
ncbi:MAG: YdeI/OmpD-associated family protein [Bacteroidetes bacterium]|nr:YdeI/OmpD-associated family protein [Bacteroidota bacterium]